MTPNQPIPADPCQTLENPICVELSPSKENGAEAQVVEGESGACKSAGLRLRWFEPSPTHHFDNQRVTRGEQPAVDTPPGGMHDKSMTKRRNGASKNRPFMQIKHGSAIVPIYRGLVNGRTRYTVAFYLNQKRVRRSFASAELAKMEARTMAHKIQEGLSQTNDLRPQEREAYIAARGILGQAGPSR